MPPAISSRVLNVFGVDYKSHLPEEYAAYLAANQPVMTCVYGNTATGKTNFKDGTVAKLAMRQPFVLFKGLTFQKLCLPGAFRPGDH
ncbi:hypothetical protein, partial [Escherichia coli]|uniref:hypothetical protein n=1 Tax=Escherichia coli TaxID=562 RepID=UPI00273E5A0F